MHQILVLGAGKIGALISGLLAESGDYRVQLADARKGAAAEVAEAHRLDAIVAFDLDATDKDALIQHVREHAPTAVVSGLPYYCNVVVAEVARAEGLHYFDLTEDVAVTEEVRKIAEGADQVFAPHDIGPYLQERWATLGEHPLVGETRMVGMMGALEIVSDKSSLERFDEDDGVGKTCRNLLVENGLVMRAVGDTIVTAPPLTLTREQVDEQVEKAWKCLDLTQKAVS